MQQEDSLGQENVSVTSNTSPRDVASMVARMRFEPFCECVIVRPGWKFKPQSAVYALQKTAFGGHEDTDAM